MSKIKWACIWFAVLCSGSCNNNNTAGTYPNIDSSYRKGSYAFDKAFLLKHSNNLVELSSEDGLARVLLSPEWQGRVMTSTASGDSGLSYGWLNYELLSAHLKRKQFNPIGGEERFWIGPEGGQYSIYFKKGDAFNIANWQVPAIIDTVSYSVANTGKSEVRFFTDARLTNYSGTNFNISINREVALLSKPQLESKLGIILADNVRTVAYESNNTITNTGENDWNQQYGLLSIWLLGMFTPTPKTIVMIPFWPLKNAKSFITDNYFGNVPPARLLIKDSILLFTCDGNYRSKIGLAPAIAKSLAASYDFENNVLTVVLPEIYRDQPYVNSKWEMQRDPYKGDVINAYNDGPLADGNQLGPFYEIESSSPALKLAKGTSASYRQTTCHLQGAQPLMKKIVQELLGVDLDEVKPNNN